MSDDVPLDDIHVLVSHPYMDIWVPLEEWMRIGPGPRPFVHPVEARRASTGESLPLTVIPLAYRNDAESRELIRRGVLSSPWPQD